VQIVEQGWPAAFQNRVLTLLREGRHYFEERKKNRIVLDLDPKQQIVEQESQGWTPPDFFFLSISQNQIEALDDDDDWSSVQPVQRDLVEVSMGRAKRLLVN